MRKTAVALTAFVAMMVPATAFGQVSIGARAGTLGIGGELSFGLGRMLAVRGGVGLAPYTFKSDFSGINYEITFPDRIWNIGIDVYPFGGLRLTGGVLNRPKFGLAATGQQTTEVGGRTYTGDIEITGSFSNENETAPYAAIGFGRATGRGLGFFVDLGAAFMGDAQLELSGRCTEASTGQPCPDFEANLETERQQAEADMNKAGEIAKLHPILQIGVRIGF